MLHPLTALAIAAVHVYLAAGHLSKLISGAIQWTHIWKGFGALAGAYVFAALASRGFSRPIAPLARPGMARAYFMQGDTARAKPAYQDFLALWNDADSDIPILVQAKSEYAKLR